jgi:hypothetical protein
LQQGDGTSRTPRACPEKTSVQDPNKPPKKADREHGILRLRPARIELSKSPKLGNTRSSSCTSFLAPAGACVISASGVNIESIFVSQGSALFRSAVLFFRKALQWDCFSFRAPSLLDETVNFGPWIAQEFTGEFVRGQFSPFFQLCDCRRTATDLLRDLEPRIKLV